MADTSARLVDDLIPRGAPIRQWVLSFPIEVRYRLAYDGQLLKEALSVFVRAVSGWYKRVARDRGYENVRVAVVTFVQRFGSALNLNPHFHSIWLDGVFVTTERGEEFVPATALVGDTVERMVETISQRMMKLFERHGLLEAGVLDRLQDEWPLLSSMKAASTSHMIATGPRAGQRVRRVLQDPYSAISTGFNCAASLGFSLHAATKILPSDREGMERLCRYVSRPPLAHGRLQKLDDGNLLFVLKRPWSDGTTAIILSALELLEKLAALVPPPRLNTVRYHGVFAPGAKNPMEALGLTSDEDSTAQTDQQKTEIAPPGRRRYRLTWAALLARVFKYDVETCPKCRGKMRIVAAVLSPASAERYLEGTGHDPSIAQLAPARPPPQDEFDFGA
jgi:hypothetical protein